MSLVLLSEKDDEVKSCVGSSQSQMIPVSQAKDLTEKKIVPVERFMSLEEKYGLISTENNSKKRKGGALVAPVKKLKSSQRTESKNGKTKPEPTIALKDFTEVDTNDPNLIENDFYTSQFFHDTSNILSVKVKGKLQWCSLPLHIAFINVLRSNSWLKLKILQYEPLEIEVLYKYFKNIGARYELSDLKFFLDKYCITFRSES